MVRNEVPFGVGAFILVFILLCYFPPASSRRALGNGGLGTNAGKNEKALQERLLPETNATNTADATSPSAREITTRLIGEWVQHFGPTEHIFHFFSDGTYTESFYDKKNHQAWLSNGKSWDHHGIWKVSGNTVAMTWENGSVHSLTLNDITQTEFHTGKATFHRNIESKSIKRAAFPESAPSTPFTADADALSDAQPSAGPHLQVINVARGDTLMLRARPMEASSIVAAIPFNYKGIIPLGVAALNEGTYWLPVQFDRYRGYVSSRYVEPVAIKPANTSPTSTPAVPTPIPVNPLRPTFSEPFPGEHYPQTRLRQLQQEELKKLSAEELRYAINEMYARRGADIANKEIKTTFSKFPWYQPQRGKSYDAVEAEFSAIEKYNVDLLGNYRSALKSGVAPQPGLPPKPQPVPLTPAQPSVAKKFDGKGKLYKARQLKDLVGQKLDNSWLYGDLMLLRWDNPRALFTTWAQFVGPTGASVEVQFSGGCNVNGSDRGQLANSGEPGTPLFCPNAKQPIEIISVSRDENGRIIAKARYLGNYKTTSGN